ncbi:hypothetical protein AwWohl_13940 [Gammaproteobacteria bacterium]|nr:hypothetical protein AwWohl_13940 [Gammaproteobacteria bacterium]
MISSMTGYAREESLTSFGSITIELRSINQRYLETYFRLADDFRSFEPQFREILTKKLSRGKVEIQLRFARATETSSNISFNSTLAQQLIEIHAKASNLLGSDRSLSASELMRFPNVITSQELDQEALKADVLDAFTKVVDDLILNRQAEGSRIQTMILTRLDLMDKLVKQAKLQRPDTAQKLKDKLLNKINDLKLEFDNGRLEQEIVIHSQRVDIEEELDRLNSHITEMISVFKRKEPVGRRLDFLTQELNRETNTLGSKAQDAILTNIAVELKVLIEQIREQIQNIE